MKDTYQLFMSQETDQSILFIIQEILRNEGVAVSIDRIYDIFTLFINLRNITAFISSKELERFPYYIHVYHIPIIISQAINNSLYCS